VDIIGTATPIMGHATAEEDALLDDQPCQSTEKQSIEKQRVLYAQFLFPAEGCHKQVTVA